MRKRGREALSELVSAQLKDIDSQIEERTAKAVIFQKAIDGLKDKVAKNKAVTEFSKELLDLEKIRLAIHQLTGKRLSARANYQRASDLLVAANSEFKLRQAAIYASIEFGEEFKFVKVAISTKYDTSQLLDFVEYNINTRDSITVKSDPDIGALFSDAPTEPTAPAIAKIISHLMEGRLKIKAGAGDVSAVLGQLLKNRSVIDYANSVKLSENDLLFRDMTGGQKAITFIELIFCLSNEKYPILIDQPEDDLDVNGVANDLVTFILKEKIHRQIIIVSHNATLVICSDSEEIIMSTMQRNGVSVYNFAYATGAIENLERREDIVKVLEGGAQALKKRMQKLRIS